MSPVLQDEAFEEPNPDSAEQASFDEALSEAQVRQIALHQASRLELVAAEKEDPVQESKSHATTFRDLPSVSKTRIVFVIVATVISAPFVMLTVHFATRQCWDAETSERGVEACGEDGKGRFIKPWFLCWSCYFGPVMNLLVAWLSDRRSRKLNSANGGSSSLDRESSCGSEAHHESKRMFMCGFCCGYEIFHDPSDAVEAGIRVKPHESGMIGVVPTFSDSTGEPFRFKSLPLHKQIGFALLPGSMDMAVTAFQFMSLLYIPPSLTVMFKSLSIVWVTIISTRLLPGRKILRYQAAAVVIAMTGAVLIATSAMLHEAAEKEANEGGVQKPSAILGIVLAILAGVCAASGSIMMEKMMVELDVDASTLVGFMGVIGFGASTILLGVVNFLPGSGPNGRVEDLADTVAVLGKNPGLVALVVLYGTVGTGLSNWTIGEATRILSGVAMLLIRNVCTFLLWGVELALFYGVAGDRLGSPLFLGPGLVKLAGFLTMSLALSVYLGFIKLPIPLLYHARPPKSIDVESSQSSAAIVIESSHDTSQPPPIFAFPGADHAPSVPSVPASLGIEAPHAGSTRRLRRAKGMRVIEERSERAKFANAYTAKRNLTTL